jgi:hypothetical protein
MHMRSLLALTLTFALLAPATPAAAGTGHRDQAAALRATAAWLAIYPPDLWIAPELPQPCRELPSGKRTCRIAIRLLAWTGGALAPWRCVARAVIPAPKSQSRHRARRTSARCAPITDVTHQPATHARRQSGAHWRERPRRSPSPVRAGAYACTCDALAGRPTVDSPARQSDAPTRPTAALRGAIRGAN